MLKIQKYISEIRFYDWIKIIKIYDIISVD